MRAIYSEIRGNSRRSIPCADGYISGQFAGGSSEVRSTTQIMRSPRRPHFDSNLNIHYAFIRLKTAVYLTQHVHHSGFAAEQLLGTPNGLGVAAEVQYHLP